MASFQSARNDRSRKPTAIETAHKAALVRSRDGPTEPVSVAAVNQSAGVLLDLVRRQHATTRRELMALTGLSRSTLAQRLEKLFGADLLIETDTGASSGGRPPSRLQFNADAGVLLACNLGTTRCRMAITTLGGQILAETDQAIRIVDGPETTLSEVNRQFGTLLKKDAHGRRPWGLGIGIPGPVERATGQVIRPPMMPGWDGVPIRPYFAGLKVPVIVEKDVNVMAWGEHQVHWRIAQTLVFLKISNGIGCGIISDGQLFRGAQGAAGSIGHIQADDASTTVCNCGNTGCLEAVASGSALVRRLHEAGVEAGTPEDVVRLATAGHAQALQLVREAGRSIGRVLAGAVNLLNPEVIVAGGVLAETDEVLLAGIREVVYQRSPPLATRNLQIQTSLLRERAGIVGAALLAMSHVLAPAAIDAMIAESELPRAAVG